jgi:hypothetical protein
MYESPVRDFSAKKVFSPSVAGRSSLEKSSERPTTIGPTTYRRRDALGEPHRRNPPSIIKYDS